MPIECSVRERKKSRVLEDPRWSVARRTRPWISEHQGGADPVACAAGPGDARILAWDSIARQDCSPGAALGAGPARRGL